MPLPASNTSIKKLKIFFNAILSTVPHLKKITQLHETQLWQKLLWESSNTTHWGLKKACYSLLCLIQAFIITGGGGGTPKQTQTKITELSWKPKYSTSPLASWGLMIPIQNCAAFRVAGKTISFVGMKGWVSLDFSSLAYLWKQRIWPWQY